MEMEEENVFTAKTVDEAIEIGIAKLGITLDEAEIEILEEGKKKLFGSLKAKVKVTKKRTDGKRAAEFIDGLLDIMGIKSVSEVLSDDEDGIKINISTANSGRVIGKRGDVLDSIQCMAGAIANIGRNEYKKVVVDCENYRVQREETLKELAKKLEKKAIETGRKVILEPMSPYERRIIHSALAESSEVKTISEGKEPARYIAVIPNNAKPNDRGVRYGEKRTRDNGRRFEHGEKRDFGVRSERGARRPRRDGGKSFNSGAKRAKKEIYFGTYLGNKNTLNEEAPATEEGKDKE